MNPDPFSGIKESLGEVANEYKTMSKVLIAFCFIAAIGLLLAGIAIFRQTS